MSISEKVLVVNLEDIEDSTRKDIINHLFTTRTLEVESFAVNDNPLSFIERSKAETDTNYVQLVRMAYFVRRVNGELEIFGCKRISKSNEKRLNNTFTVLFGGHTNISDKCGTLLDTLDKAMLREISEELSLPKELKRILPKVSYIYTPDSSKDFVSNYHACDIVAFDMTNMSNIYILETDKLSNGAFYTINQLKEMNLENWSQLIVESLN